MDKQTIKSMYPILLDYLKNQGAGRTTLYRYKREIMLMLQPSSDISELDRYCRNVEQTDLFFNRDICARFSRIKRIWNFFEIGEFPIIHQNIKEPLSTYYNELIIVCVKKCNEIGLKERTISNYTDVAKSFFRFLTSKQISSLNDVSEPIIIEYFTITRSVHRGRTISCRLRKLFLMCNEVVGIEVANRLASFVPSIPNKTHVYPDLNEKESISIDTVLTDYSNRLTDIERAVGCIAFYMGLRCSDIASLCSKNIDFKHKSIRLTQSKTGIELEIPMPTVCSNAIVNYVKYSRPKTDIPNIFVRSKSLKTLDRRDMYAISVHILHMANISMYNRKMRGLHLFRHHFASTLIHNDVDVSIASALLGHNNSKSTFVYLGTDINKLRTISLPLP
jgi:site-specific recombinase XerD